VRKRLLAKEVLSGRRREEQAIGLDVEPWVVETSEEMRRRLQATGVRLEGDWQDLVPVPAPGVDPAETPAAELVAAARDGFEGLTALLGDRSGRDALPRWPDPSDPADAVEALAGLVRIAAAGERA
jgi:hypothetical protein